METDPWSGVLTIVVMIFAAIAAKSLDDQDEEKKIKILLNIYFSICAGRQEFK